MRADDFCICAVCIGCLPSLCKFSYAQLHYDVIRDLIVIDILSDAIHDTW